MSLYQKHRPTSLRGVVGNDKIVSALQSMLEDKESFPHAILLHGPTGCGKTTLARIIATELGGENDLHELDSAQFRGIDTAREIRQKSQYAPLRGGVRVYIMDEVHKLTNDAQNGMLKVLEDAPSHVYFILCTTDPNKLLSTVRGRCSMFQVNTLTDEEMTKLIRRIIKREEKNFTKETVAKIVEAGAGHPRNTINILEQLLNVEPDERESMIQKIAEEQDEIIALARALVKRKNWTEVNKILKSLKVQNQDAEAIRRVIIGYASTILLNKDDVTCGLILEEFIEPFYDSGFPQLVYACYSVCHA
jgi:DNA polymerase-3 subunit gamma/tau